MRWYATGPIYFNGIRAFFTGALVPDSLVVEHGLEALGAVSRTPVTTSEGPQQIHPSAWPDTDDEREAFVPSRLSAAKLREVFLPRSEYVPGSGGGGGTGNVTGVGVTRIVRLTQAEYDALPTKDAETFYLVVDAAGDDFGTFLEGLIRQHEQDVTPHEAYDALPSLTILFENGLI